MIGHHPITGKEIRILQTDHSLSRERKTLEYVIEKKENSVWDTISEKVEADFRIVLETTSIDEMKKISRESKLILISKHVIESIGIENFRETQIQNLICLEEMEQLYPHLGSAWDGTIEDAIYLLAALLRYRFVAGVKGDSKRGVEKETNKPFRLWWVTQYYIPTKAKRRREIEKALSINKSSKLIDKIILLNETSMGVKGETIEEKIIGHRITYEDVLKFSSECPDDVIIAFANADISIDDNSWKNLWSVSLENVFLALLRYDVPESGDTKEAKLFGPRSDSQDTWVIRAKDVKSRGENVWENCNIPFGKAGCDNAIAMEMLRKKFRVVNPCVSLRTWHYHSSGVRAYNPQDIVDRSVFLYVNPTGFHDIQPVLKFKKENIIEKSNSISTLVFDVKGDDSKEWLEKINKEIDLKEKKWKMGRNTLTPVSEPILYLENCFSTNEGLAFTNEELMIGSGTNAQKRWSKEIVHGMSPTVPTENVLIAPWPKDYENNRESFMIHYLSKILRLKSVSNEKDIQFLCEESKKIVECLECIDWGTEKGCLLRKEEDMQVWAKKAWVLPVSENETCLSEDMKALRRYTKGWIQNPVANEKGIYKLILVDDGSKLSTEIEEALDEHWDVKVVYPGRTSVERMWDVLRGAWGIICMKEGLEGCGWNWILPEKAKVFEVESKSKDGIQISSACNLDHTFVKKTKESILASISYSKEEWSDEKEEGNSLPVVWLPRKDLEGYFGHPGDSFREMVRLWGKKGYCKVKEHPTATMVWWNEVGPKGVLLYDRPNHDWRLAAPMEEKEYRLALYGNPKPVSGGKAWFFWPRRPELVEEIVEKDGVKGFGERKSGIVFYGKTENKVQEKRRTQMDWKSACSEWYMVKGASEAYPFTQKEYLEKLASSRFGLCLAGYGLKCHREIECMAMGCVPLVAPECDMDSYAEPPLEGVHYLRVNSPEEALKISETMDQETWEKMSNAARVWWAKVCSCKGSFTLTKKLIEEE